MIIGNCTYSVRNYLREGEMDLLDFPAFNADLDINALEYNDMFFESWDDDFLAEVKKSAADAGCYIQCLTCGGNFASDDEDEREESVETIRERLHNAATLGRPSSAPTSAAPATRSAMRPSASSASSRASMSCCPPPGSWTSRSPSRTTAG